MTAELTFSIRTAICPGCSGIIVGSRCRNCTWNTDFSHNTNMILTWTDRMAHAYGGTVYERYGKAWDWGQAICREQYGPHWSALNLQENTDEDVERALAWEQGDWPKWARKPKAQP